jgi:hypothetical protein
MQTEQDKLVTYIKAQTEAFLKEMDDFYPFGAAVTTHGELKPLAASLDDDELSVQALLSLLEEHVDSNLLCKRFTLAAIAVAVTIKEAGQAFDAIQIRLYERDTEMRVINYKYSLTKGNTSWW